MVIIWNITDTIRTCGYDGKITDHIRPNVLTRVHFQSYNGDITALYQVTFFGGHSVFQVCGYAFLVFHISFTVISHEFIRLFLALNKNICDMIPLAEVKQAILA